MLANRQKSSLVWFEFPNTILHHGNQSIVLCIQCLNINDLFKQVTIAKIFYATTLGQGEIKCNVVVGKKSSNNII